MQKGLARSLRLTPWFPAASVTGPTVLLNTRGVIYQYTGPPNLFRFCTEAAGTLHRGSCEAGAGARGGIEYNIPLCLGVGSILHDHTRTERIVIWRGRGLGSSLFRTLWKASLPLFS